MDVLKVLFYKRFLLVGVVMALTKLTVSHHLFYVLVEPGAVGALGGHVLAQDNAVACVT